MIQDIYIHLFFLQVKIFNAKSQPPFFSIIHSQHPRGSCVRTSFRPHLFRLAPGLPHPPEFVCVCTDLPQISLNGQTGHVCSHRVIFLSFKKTLLTHLFKKKSPH